MAFMCICLFLLQRRTKNKQKAFKKVRFGSAELESKPFQNRKKKNNQNRKASRPKSQEMVCTQLCPGCPHWKLLPSSLVAFLRAAPPGKGGPSSASSWPLFEENLISLKQARQTDAMGCTSFTAL